jgi:cytochrome b561
MRKLIIIFMFFSCSFMSAQDADLLKQLQQDEKTDTALLPPKIIFTQRMLWGEKGLFRTTGWAPLTVEHRKKEMQTRRFMLKAHQVLGFITLGGMVAQGIVGSQLYNGKPELKDTHEALATGINITYSMAALSSLFAPPPLVNRDKGLTSLRLHKWLAVVHMSGMIATNILAGQIENNPDLKSVHRAVAFTTFAAYTAAVVVIKF